MTPPSPTPLLGSFLPGFLPLSLLLLSCGEAPTDSLPPPPLAPTPISSPPAPRRLLLSAAGDLVLNALAMSAIRAHPTERDGYLALLDGYARSLHEDEIAYLNLELPLVDDVVALDPGWPASLTERPRRAPVLGATPVLATVLASIGVDVVGVANNHAYDQGHAGLRRTLAALDAAGIAHAGASPDSPDAALAPRILERDGARVAFLALNRRATDPDPVHLARVEPLDRALRAIAAARERADVVVVAPHWGRDFAERADSEQRALAARFVEAGADLVLGTGPHVLHEVARVPSARGEAVIAYSLGNLASGMGRAYRLGHPPRDYVHPANVRPEARDGLVLRVALALDEDGAITIERLEGIALWTENDFLTRDDRSAPVRIRVVPLADAAPEVRQERAPIVRAALGDTIALTP